MRRPKSRRPSGKGGGFFRGLLENVVGPLGLILAGVGIVLLIGWWAMGGRDSGKDDAAAENPPPSQQPAPSQTAPSQTAPGQTSPAQTPPAQTSPTQQPAPSQTPPAQTAPSQTPPAQQSAQTSPAPAGDDAAIRALRKEINRAGSATGMTMVVYYLDGLTESTAIQPVEMKVPVNVGRIRSTVDHLINAPAELELHAPFPAGTTVKGANLKDGVAIIDLSKEAAGVRGSAASTAIQHLLVYSLTEIEGVSAVELRIEGHPAQLDQIVWDKPVTRDQLRQQGTFAVAPVVKYEGR